MSDVERDTAAEYNGELYHSLTEATYAAYWDSIGVQYQHWPATYEFPSGRWYTPDFYLPETDLIVEIKNGYEIEHGAHNISYLGFLLKKSTALADGVPANAKWYFFSPDYEHFNHLPKPENQKYGESVWVASWQWQIGVSEEFIEYLRLMREAREKPYAPSREARTKAREQLQDLRDSRIKLASLTS